MNELAYIILSGQTELGLSQRAYQTFKHRFPRWDDVPDSPLGTIAASLRVGGLAIQKAKYLREIARKVRRDFGRVTLAPLRAMRPDDAERYLRALPGVGVKTARCVALYSLDHEVFPADVHCLRIMTRLGWIRWEGGRGEALADAAQQKIPRRLRRLMHIRLLQHGRTVCKSRPHCDACILADCCPTGWARGRLVWN